MNFKNELLLMLSIINNHLWRVNKVHTVHDFHPKVI